MIDTPEETLDIRKLRKLMRDTAVIPKAELTRPVVLSACLVCIHATHPDRGTRFQIGEKGLMIGRDSECAIHVNDNSVSRRHAAIELRPNGEYQVIDLASSNGTFVNDNRVGTATLKDGCYLRVGNCMFRFLAGGNIEAAYHEEIQRLSNLDPLTGLYNRRSFDEFLEREIERASRHCRPLAVMLFDIDHFKAINDRYGHPVGDYTLRSFSSRIKALTRVDELLARYGGEEFAFVMPETTLERAIRCADHFRRVIAEQPFEFDGQKFSVTISAGVGISSNGEKCTAASLLQQADEYLYQAKQTGRNRVVPMVPYSRNPPQSAHNRGALPALSRENSTKVN